MSRWIVNMQGRLVGAESMEEVRNLARSGDLGAGDLVQPPGSRDWLYASEVPEFAAVLRPTYESAGVAEAPRRTVPLVLAAVLAVAGLGAWKVALDVKASIPTADQLSLTDGAHALPPEEAIVTVDGAALRAGPGEGAEVAKLEAQKTVKLLAKKGLWWQVSAEGQEGWVEAAHIIPGWYFQGEEVRAKYNPLFNPTQFLLVKNAVAEAGAEIPKGFAKFAFMFSNESDYTMSGLKLSLTLKDVVSGTVIETRELAIDGEFPAGESKMVGTLLDKKDGPPQDGKIMSDYALEKLVVTEPSARDRWADGALLPLPAGKEAGDIGVEVKVLEVTPDRSSLK